MVISSEIRRQYRDDDHREDEPYFSCNLLTANTNIVESKNCQPVSEKLERVSLVFDLFLLEN